RSSRVVPRKTAIPPAFASLTCAIASATGSGEARSSIQSSLIARSAPAHRRNDREFIPVVQHGRGRDVVLVHRERGALQEVFERGNAFAKNDGGIVDGRIFFDVQLQLG